jgi:hypothetical protein
MNWITLHDPTGEPIYVFVGRVSCVRPTAGDAGLGGNAWIDLTGGKPIATNERPAEIMPQRRELPRVVADQTLPGRLVSFP